MKFKRLLLCVSLAVALTGQSLWATDDDSADPVAEQRLALVGQVSKLLTEGQQKLENARISFNWGTRVNSLKAAVRQFGEAKTVTADCLDLKSADGESLAAQTFSCLGDAHHRLSEIESEEQKAPNALLAGEYYLKARLLGGDDTLKDKMSAVKTGIERLAAQLSPRSRRIAQFLADSIMEFETFPETDPRVSATHADFAGCLEQFETECSESFAEPRGQSNAGLPPRVVQSVREVQARGGRAVVLSMPTPPTGVNSLEFTALVLKTLRMAGLALSAKTLDEMAMQANLRESASATGQ